MIPLHKEVTSIGRKQADIILDDSKVSGAHAEIRKKSNRFELIDLASTNGTFVNRRKIDRCLLADQDVVEIGFTTFCFFQDTRDFHGEVEEVTASVKTKFQAPTQTTNVSNLTTTRTLRQASVQLRIIEGAAKGECFKFQKSHIIMGRSDVDLLVNDMDASRNHALIEVLSPKLVFLRDLESTNGTYLNGKRVQSAKLQDGDRISIGNTLIEFGFDPSEGGGS